MKTKPDLDLTSLVSESSPLGTPRSSVAPKEAQNEPQEKQHTPTEEIPPRATIPAEKQSGQIDPLIAPKSPSDETPVFVPPKNPQTHTLPSPSHLLRAAAILLLLAGIGTLWLSAHHIMRTEDGIAILRKRHLGFQHTLVDIRTWDHQAFQATPALTRAMFAQGYGDMVKLPPPKPTLFQTVERRVRELGTQTATTIEQASQKAGAGIKRAGEATAESLRRAAETTSTNLATASDATTTWAEEIATYWLDKAL